MSYQDGVLIIRKGNEIIVSCYEPELVMIEDKICELYEEGIIPANINLSLE